MHSSPPVATNSSQSFPFKVSRLLLALVFIFGLVAPSFHPARAQAPGETLVFPTSVQWPRQRGVTWYRLQIGSDEAFRDIHFDRRVLGDRFFVRDLAPGYYFWRIAASDDRLGEFSRPLRFFVPGGVVTSFTIRNSGVRKAVSR